MNNLHQGFHLQALPGVVSSHLSVDTKNAHVLPVLYVYSLPGNLALRTKRPNKNGHSHLIHSNLNFFKILYIAILIFFNYSIKIIQCYQ